MNFTLQIVNVFLNEIELIESRFEGCLTMLFLSLFSKILNKNCRKCIKWTILNVFRSYSSQNLRSETLS